MFNYRYRSMDIPIYGDRYSIPKEVIEKAYRGTTTVGMALKDFVVLAADKKATAGLYVAHKNVKKIVRLTENSAITIAGLVADAQTLADYIRAEAYYYYYINNRPMSIRSMASLLGLILNEYKYFPFIVQLILGGYDYYEGAKLFSIDYFGDVTEERYTATGSGSPIAIGVIESGYRPEMSIDDAVSLVVKAVATASMRDVFSGGIGVDVVVIGKDFYREMTFQGEEIRKIIGRASQ
ncbi:proteasome endopeptidase complex, beta component [Ignisphaera aggregans DSM 17230]|uniref:Proteasome subunit beta n=1 Tax=Ignisphaera aggregans (strain DSM 17230 / JCM 13409 / AQ1.S1) TaxID=583356 RepID=E0SPF5_IGNAA|nr:proteasome endopeptidase complex, beta component [Ignisphaera aggregans DSM 17230]